jgi:cell division protein FtsB
MMAATAKALTAPQQHEAHRSARRRVRRVKARVATSRARIGLLAAIPVIFATAYIWLNSTLTAQTYQLHDAQQRGAVLMRHYNELRQQEAKLESLPRLQAAAAKLHMTAPQRVAVLEPPQTPSAAKPAIGATLADMVRWFGVR